MLRFFLYVGGVSAGLAAWLVLENRNRANRVIPATKAAAMLQEAWADHHTQAWSSSPKPALIRRSMLG